MSVSSVMKQIYDYIKAGVGMLNFGLIRQNLHNISAYCNSGGLEEH